MSLFKKPTKKPASLSRRIYMEVDEDEPMEVDVKHKKKDRKDKEKPIKPQKSSLLSFGDEGIFHNNIRGLG